MAIIPLITTHNNAGERIANSAYEYVQIPVATSAGTVVAVAPFDGKLKRAFLTVGSLHNATNNYITMLMANKSNSDAAMLGSNDTGDGTDTLQYGKRVLVVGVAADLVITEGDHLELTTTVQGTLTASSIVTLVIEVD